MNMYRVLGTRPETQKVGECPPNRAPELTLNHRKSIIRHPLPLWITPGSLVPPCLNLKRHVSAEAKHTHPRDCEARWGLIAGLTRPDRPIDLAGRWTDAREPRVRGNWAQWGCPQPFLRCPLIYLGKTLVGLRLRGG